MGDRVVTMAYGLVFGHYFRVSPGSPAYSLGVTHRLSVVVTRWIKKTRVTRSESPNQYPNTTTDLVLVVAILSSAVPSYSLWHMHVKMSKYYRQLNILRTNCFKQNFTKTSLATPAKKNVFKLLELHLTLQLARAVLQSENRAEPQQPSWADNVAAVTALASRVPASISYTIQSCWCTKSRKHCCQLTYIATWTQRSSSLHSVCFPPFVDRAHT